jgi:flagellar hook protein FlgE
VDGVPSGAAPTTLTFDAVGQLTPAVTSQNLALALGAAAPQTIKIDYLGSTLQKGETSTSTNVPDGYAAGTYNKLELGEDGSVIAKYSNGESQIVGVVALATFADEDGLTPVDSTSWTSSNRSGSADVGEPGTGRAGKLAVGGVEQSNVDVTSELVGLMTSQRNYQANSKVLQTENTMLQSLMQAL